MKGRVLVVDDEPAIRDTMRMILEYDGYECLVAGSVEGLDRRAATSRIWSFSISRCPASTGSRC